MIEKLEWDSNFFGYKIGKLDCRGKHLQIEEIDGLEKYDLIYLYAPNKLPVKQFGEVYSKVFFKYKLKSFDEQQFLPAENISILKGKPGEEDYENLYKLALQSGKYSRFKIDPDFSNDEFERLYKKWVENSIEGEIADKVLVYRGKNNTIEGIITLSFNKKDATIGLLAVDSEVRRQGIGETLIKNAKYIAKINKKRNLMVATQRDNKKACNFYLKNEFNQSKIVHIYHLWNR